MLEQNVQGQTNDRLGEQDKGESK